MKRRQMIYLSVSAIFVLAGIFAWNTMARAAYESAEYKVVESDGKFEVREYPDLMFVATTTKLDAQGRDGSFMKLRRGNCWLRSTFYSRSAASQRSSDPFEVDGVATAFFLAPRS